MANRYSLGDKSIVDRLTQDFTFEVGFSSAQLKPFNLKEFEASEDSSLRTTATTEKKDLIQVSGTTSGTTTKNITQFIISANIDTSNVSGAFNCKFCGVILKKSGVALELLSTEPLVEIITSSSTLTVQHTYTFNFEV